MSAGSAESAAGDLCDIIAHNNKPEPHFVPEYLYLHS